MFAAMLMQGHGGVMEAKRLRKCLVAIIARIHYSELGTGCRFAPTASTKWVICEDPTAREPELYVLTFFFLY